jgi:8-oxo-dGTP pyrophosphatase MutT (NUDIX family)
MVAGSILPIAIHKNQLFFLFGKENELADTPGFSDFGGGVDNGETPFRTALREGAEELTGFLGDEMELEALIKQNGGTHNITHETYHMHLFVLEYDENLPKYYNQNHRFLWNRMDKEQLEKTKLFEKAEIRWFSLEDMKKNKAEFRQFYQDIIELLLKNVNKIQRFAEKQVHRIHKTKMSKKMSKKTRKLQGGK